MRCIFKTSVVLQKEKDDKVDIADSGLLGYPVHR